MIFYGDYASSFQPCYFSILSRLESFKLVENSLLTRSILLCNEDQGVLSPRHLPDALLFNFQSQLYRG